MPGRMIITTAVLIVVGIWSPQAEAQKSAVTVCYDSLSNGLTAEFECLVHVEKTISQCIETNDTAEDDWETCIGVAASACGESDWAENQKRVARCIVAESSIWRKILAKEISNLAHGLNGTRLKRLRTINRKWRDLTRERCAFIGRSMKRGGGVVEESECTLNAVAQWALDLRELRRALVDE